jgi:hypothetical protein
MESTLVIYRRNKYFGKLLFYEIILDGDDVGIIFNGRSISIPIEAGNHSVKLKVDWGGSKEINFSVSEGEEIKFECEDSGSLLQVLFFPFTLPYYLTFGINDMIKLRQVI